MSDREVMVGTPFHLPSLTTPHVNKLQSKLCHFVCHQHYSSNLLPLYFFLSTSYSKFILSSFLLFLCPGPIQSSNFLLFYFSLSNINVTAANTNKFVSLFCFVFVCFVFFSIYLLPIDISIMLSTGNLKYNNNK